MRLPIFVAPLFGRYSRSPGYSSVCKAYAGVRGAYAGRTQIYGERTQYAVSTRTISSRVVSLRVLSSFSQFCFLDSDERKVFRKACRS